MTKAQENTVRAIRNYVEKHDLYADVYEIKQFEVKDTDYGVVIVYSETGLKDDEGTMAAVFGRTHRHIFIGKRGGGQNI